MTFHLFRRNFIALTSKRQNNDENISVPSSYKANRLYADCLLSICTDVMCIAQMTAKQLLITIRYRTYLYSIEQRQTKGRLLYLSNFDAD